VQFLQRGEHADVREAVGAVAAEDEDDLLPGGRRILRRGRRCNGSTGRPESGRRKDLEEQDETFLERGPQ
jgi:hypothetical protein